MLVKAEKHYCFPFLVCLTVCVLSLGQHWLSVISISAGRYQENAFILSLGTNHQTSNYYKEINHKEKTLTNIKVFKLYLTSYVIHDL